MIEVIKSCVRSIYKYLLSHHIPYYLLSESLSFSNFLRGGSPLVQKRTMSIAPNPDVKEMKAANFLPGGKMKVKITIKPR